MAHLLADTRIIVSLDVETAAQAWTIVQALGSEASVYKVGLQLLTAAGPGIVRELVSSGKQVFLDLKLFEIPNSVAGAIKSAGELGVSMVTVHASGGTKILRAAVDAAKPFPNLRILALTVVTSMCDDDLLETGIDTTVENQVIRLARLADAAGCHGIVASAQEVAILRTIVRPDMLIFTPGIQLSAGRPTDQARVGSPYHAIKAGATYIMLGRSITQASDYLDVFDKVSGEILSALSY